MELKHTAKNGGRLSTVLKEEMRVSTGLMNRLKWQDKLLVNDIARHTDFIVAPGDVVSLALDEETPDYPAEDAPITVLYEDDDMLAVDKPAGMLIHPSRATNTGTLANRVLAYYQRTGQSCAFHPVTRLDRDTFGIVLLAKNSHIHALLKAGELQKTYHALTFGAPKEKQGIIDAPIARRELPSLLRYVDPAGKPSVTKYTVLERTGNAAKLALQPVTGRTHQLRVHCAYMGYPILGDPQYATEQSRAFSEEMGLFTQQLCAYSLEFIHPITGQKLHLLSRMDTKRLK